MGEFCYCSNKSVHNFKTQLLLISKGDDVLIMFEINLRHCIAIPFIFITYLSAYVHYVQGFLILLVRQDTQGN